MSLPARLLSRVLPWIPRKLIGGVARRYIAGETLEDGLRVASGLNQQGFRTTMDLLGEDTTKPAQAHQALADYRKALEAIESHGIDGNVSVKPTQFGLRIDSELCFGLFRSLVGEARDLGHFVRLDMEDSSCTDPTLSLYRRLRGEFDNVGIVLQSRLHRSVRDLDSLRELIPNVRMVKGVYLEPPSIAWQDAQEIRDQFMTLSETLLQQGAYVAFATHDQSLVDGALETVDRLGIGKSGYEFQHLLGVRTQLGRQLRDAGHPVRIYVPFGRDWYPYSMRRLRENPQIAVYVLKAMFSRQDGPAGATW
jgi:proline dehydrogenase